MCCYDEETAKILITKILETASIKHKCFVILALLCGFRRGEIVGLHWDDIDFKNKKKSINRSAYYLSDKGVQEKEPKTDSSNRTIAVPNICFVFLNNGELSKVK